MTDCVVVFHADASVFSRVVCSTKPDSCRVGFPDLLDGRYYRVGRNLPQDRVRPFAFSASNFYETNWHREASWTMVSCLHRYFDLDPCFRHSRFESSQCSSNDRGIYVRHFLRSEERRVGKECRSRWWW